MFLSIAQIKAARALLDWTQQDLADNSDLSSDQIRNFESGRARQSSVLEGTYKTFTEQGLKFLDGGVIKSKKEVLILEGQKGFLDFYENIYNEMKNNNDKLIYVSNVDERKFVEWQGEQLKEHTQRMIKLGIKYNILIEHGDTFFPAATYAEYRWTPKEMFYSVPFYIYGDKIAIMLFKEEPKIYIISEPEIANIYKQQFESLWNKSSKVTK